MRRPLFLAFALLPLIPVALLSAQLEPPSTGGVVALDHELRMLGHEKRVLMIGAHPDDEDTELLTVLVRGLGVEAAYLSLNRGEGGQNLIGPELGEALGLIRTEELLAARRLDGARQYFTRAYDFGYSKSLDETWQHWPQDTILKDVVRDRPAVPSPDHRLGLQRHAAGRPRPAPGRRLGRAGGVRRGRRFDSLSRARPRGGPPPLDAAQALSQHAVRHDGDHAHARGGALDRAAGLSFHQIAMAGRSLHRSQDMGRIQGLGRRPVRLALVEDRTGGARRPVRRDRHHQRCRGGPRRRMPGSCSRSGRAWRCRRLAPTSWPTSTAPWPSRPGVVCDARSDDDRVVPGQRVAVTLECWNTGDATRTVTATLRAAKGFSCPAAPRRRCGSTPARWRRAR